MPYSKVPEDISRHGRRNGGIKVHSVIHANEGVPCDVKFTSAATNDTFMLAPSSYNHGQMQYREQVVLFRKGEINHLARIITYVDIKKGKQPKLIRLLTNDFDMSIEDIILIYHRRWQIESLFRQIKHNFPLRYFYGESENAIKIQFWFTLIANMLMPLLQMLLKRRWSFSGLATIIRIVLMYYITLNTFFEKPDEDLKKL